MSGHPWRLGEATLTSVLLEQPTAPLLYGQPARLRVRLLGPATETGTPAGSVQLQRSASMIANAGIVGSPQGIPLPGNVRELATATFDVSLTVGEHALVAVFPGTSRFAGSTSQVVRVDTCQEACSFARRLRASRCNGPNRLR